MRMLSVTSGLSCTSPQNGSGPHPSKARLRAASTAHKPPRRGRFTHNDIAFVLPLLTRACDTPSANSPCLNCLSPFRRVCLGLYIGCLIRKYVNQLFQRHFSNQDGPIATLVAKPANMANSDIHRAAKQQPLREQAKLIPSRSQSIRRRKSLRNRQYRRSGEGPVR